MFMKKASIISLLASLFFSCHADTERVLEPVDFKQAIQNDSTAIIIDVRTADEFKEGHLHGAMSLDYLDSKTFKKESSTLIRHIPIISIAAVVDVAKVLPERWRPSVFMSSI